MGYVTQHKITAFEEEYSKPINISHLCDEFEEVTGYEFEYDELSIESESIKWYDCQKDMLQISKNHPKITFLVEGSGEEQGDIWRTYYHNGKSASYQPDMTWPEFNPEDLK